MLQEAAIALPERSERSAPARLRNVRPEPEAAYAAAAASRDPGERLIAHTLDSLIWLARAAIAVAFTVDERGLVEIAMMQCASGHDRRDASALLRRLRQLEASDPFSPRRAAACGASVMSAADVGGGESYARSVHGMRLRGHGYGAPVVMYLWRADRIVAGVTLLRRWNSPPFAAGAVRLLRELHPLLEHAFSLAGAKSCAPELHHPGAPAATLTAREAEAARLVADGVSNADIAETLGVSEGTVKAHLTKVYAKLGVRSRTQLALVMSDVD